MPTLWVEWMIVTAMTESRIQWQASSDEILHDFKFMVQDHAKVQHTIDTVIGTKEACNFCQAAPIVIVYRGWDDKIVTACKLHEEIVKEMIERDELRFA